MKRFLSGGSDKGNQRKKPEPAIDDAKGKDGNFLTLNGFLMIFDGTAAYDSKHRQKITRARSTWPSQPHRLSSGGRSLPSPSTDPTTRIASHSQGGIRSW